MLLLGVVQAQAAGDVSFGSYDLLATEILAGTAASVTFSSLGDYATDYQHLQIRYTARGTNDSNSIFMKVTLNSDTGSNYSWHLLRATGSAVQAFAGASQAFIQEADIPAARSAANIFGAVVFDLLDAFETTKFKTTRSLTGFYGADTQVQLTSGNYRSTSASSSITFAPNSGNLLTGSRFSLYGIRAV
jgi:hypothetical protein